MLHLQLLISIRLIKFIPLVGMDFLTNTFMAPSRIYIQDQDLFLLFLTQVLLIIDILSHSFSFLQVLHLFPVFMAVLISLLISVLMAWAGIRGD